MFQSHVDDEGYLYPTFPFFPFIVFLPFHVAIKFVHNDNEEFYEYKHLKQYLSV